MVSPCRLTSACGSSNSAAGLFAAMLEALSRIRNNLENTAEQPKSSVMISKIASSLQPHSPQPACKLNIV